MAAPFFVQASTGVPVTGTSATVQIVTTPATDNVLFLDVLVDGTGTPTLGAITNIENLVGTAGTMLAMSSSYQVGSPGVVGNRWLWVGRVTTTGTVSVSVNAPGAGTDCYCRLYEFSGVDVGSALTDIIENGAASPPDTVNNAGTSTSVLDVAVVANGADRLALNFTAVSDDVTIPAFTGQTGGTWAEAVAEYADATGTQGTLSLQTATLATSGTIDGGTATISVSAGWNTIGFALKPDNTSGGGEPVAPYTTTVLTDSPRAYYRMEETSGQPQDSSGNAMHTTTSVGVPTYGGTGALATSPFSKSIEFNGGERFTAPDNALLDLGDVFTLEAWVKRGSLGTLQTLIDKGSGSYQFAFLADNTFCLAKQEFAIIVASTATITDTISWHHLVVTKSGATVKLYLDAIDVTGVVTNATTVNTTTTLNIGASYVASQLWDGHLDEVALYATALSLARVQAHYNAATVTSGRKTMMLTGVG